MDTELLNLLFYSERTIKYLNKKGLISDDGITRIEIYKSFDALVAKGFKKTDAFVMVAERFCKSVDRVQSIIYELNKTREDVSTVD